MRRNNLNAEMHYVREQLDQFAREQSAASAAILEGSRSSVEPVEPAAAGVAAGVPDQELSGCGGPAL